METEEKLLPEHGAWGGLYYDEENDIQGFQLRARNIIDFKTPMFRVTPPTAIKYEETDETTSTYTLTKIIDGQTFTQVYTIKIKGRGTDSEEVESMILPDGQVITFENWTIN